MIKKTIFYLILILINIEAKESICSDKEDNGYSKEELQAYYIREQKIKKIEKKCKSKDIHSCVILAIEHIYNFHPCEGEHERLSNKGTLKLEKLCKKNSAEACFMLGEVGIDENGFKLACQKDKKYCPPLGYEINRYQPLYWNDIDALSNYQQVKKEINRLKKGCNVYKDRLACFTLQEFFTNRTKFPFKINSWVEFNEKKAVEYRYKSCIYNYESSYGCVAESEIDYQSPWQWLTDRAKKLEIPIPEPEFVPIKKKKTEDKKNSSKNIKKRSCERSQVIRYTDKTFRKEWQINADIKFGIIIEPCHEDIGYLDGTTLDICKKLIPKDSATWRLPNKKELLQSIGLFNKNIDNQYYWTSEQSKEDSMDYWVVDVRDSTTHQVYKNNHYGKGCVYVRDLDK